MRFTHIFYFFLKIRRSVGAEQEKLLLNSDASSEWNLI